MGNFKILHRNRNLSIFRSSIFRPIVCKVPFFFFKHLPRHRIWLRAFVSNRVGGGSSIALVAAPRVVSSYRKQPDLLAGFRQQEWWTRDFAGWARQKYRHQNAFKTAIVWRWASSPAGEGKLEKEGSLFYVSRDGDGPEQPSKWHDAWSESS
jgi:hypothetical protein